MVLEAAQMYFDSSSNYLDPDIELSKTCLNLLQNSKESSVLCMFDLMDAIKLLHKDFQLNILPYSVRVCEDKIGLLRQALENTAEGYKKIKQLLKLSILLHLDNLDLAGGESIILEMAGTSALDAGDVKFGVQICQSLMGKGYQTGWNLFSQLAKFQSDPPIMESDTRHAFINYALTICPDKEIISVLNTKYLIEIGSLQTRLTELSPSDSAVDAEILKIQGEESIVHDTLNKIQIQEFLKTTTRWINPLKEMAEVVKSGSGALLTRRGHGFHSLESESSLGTGNMNSNLPSDDSNEDFEKESHPAFYMSEQQSRTLHTSILSYQYDSFSNASSAIYTQVNPGLELCILHNRIWHLEKLILGREEAGARDQDVLEQLVCGVLPQDLPWGLAILFSIEDNEIEMLTFVLSKLPVSRIATLVALYHLALRIQKLVLGLNSIADDALCYRDPNKIISQTSEILEDGDSQWDDGEISLLPKFTQLYKQYEARLNNFR